MDHEKEGKARRLRKNELGHGRSTPVRCHALAPCGISIWSMLIGFEPNVLIEKWRSFS
jgi:hypothetical protein